jgi:hypothetical protein
MRKRITLLIAAVVMALSMSFSAVAFAANPFENPAGNKPPGQTPNPNPGK